MIRQEVLDRLHCVNEPYCILVVPLYTESEGFFEPDRVLVVDASERAQMLRLAQRDGTNREMARSILSAQATREQRLSLADDVIENNSSPEALKAQVERLHQLYLQLSGHRLSHDLVSDD